MSALETIIKDEIAKNGPMSAARLMELALGHPEHGYYMSQEPFGSEGDFTTAPEISQMFGEILGAWAADQWMQMGEPEKFTLLECGPGRGTLMADMLRVTQSVSGFHEAAQVTLLENSERLKAQQKAQLAYNGFEQVDWVDDLDGLLDDMPVIVIANEFLDALPVHQYLKGLNGWQESCVMLEDDALVWGMTDENVDEALIPSNLRGAMAGSIFEVSHAREGFVKNLVQKMNHGAAGLFIDYGHERSACGETLQAVKDHAYHDALSDIGQADITAHVDFEAIQGVLEQAGAEVLKIIEQGAFLKAMGIEIRAQMLADQNPDHASDIGSQLTRLISSNEMGRLFKVLEFSKEPSE